MYIYILAVSTKDNGILVARLHLAPEKLVSKYHFPIKGIWTPWEAADSGKEQGKYKMSLKHFMGQNLERSCKMRACQRKDFLLAKAGMI